MAATSFRRILFFIRVPKRTRRFLIRRLAGLIYYRLPKKNFDSDDCETVSSSYVVRSARDSHYIQPVVRQLTEKKVNGNTKLSTVIYILEPNPQL
jgi:hypothetical protein